MHPFFALPAVSADRWQMQQGERFALDGLLAAAAAAAGDRGRDLRGRQPAAHRRPRRGRPRLRPRPEGGRARRRVRQRDLPHRRLGRAPAAGAGRARGARAGHVDFALVDAAHTREAVRGDGAALLAADACRQTVIVFHDSANAEVRAGLEDLDLPSTPRSRSRCSTASRATWCRLMSTRSSSARRSTASRWSSSTPIATRTRAATKRPSSCRSRRCTRRTPPAQEPPAPARGKAAAVGSAAAVSALAGRRRRAWRSDRPPAPLIRPQKISVEETQRAATIASRNS